MLAAGAFRIAWFSRLKASARKLALHTSWMRKRFSRGRVHFVEAGSPRKIPAGVAPGVLGRNCERRDVPPLCDGLSGGGNDGDSGNEVRPLAGAII
jgi:hypothetical protein